MTCFDAAVTRTKQPTRSTAAARSVPAPPEREILSVQVPALIDQGKFTEATALVRGSHLEEPAKEHELVLLKLAQRASLPRGGDRLKIEQELLDLVKSARSRTSTDSRLARLALARSGIEGDLDPRNAPEAWDIVAESYEMSGDAAKAGGLELRAAARALELGQPQDAAGFRLRGGGFLFQAGKYTEADAVLSAVADDPLAGACRAKAGMFRALARGRALAARRTWGNRRNLCRGPAPADSRFSHGPGHRRSALALGHALARLPASAIRPKRSGTRSCRARHAGWMLGWPPSTCADPPSKPGS